MQMQIMASSRREADLQRRVIALSHDAQSASESKALLEVLTDRNKAAHAALEVGSWHDCSTMSSTNNTAVWNWDGARQQ